MHQKMLFLLKGAILNILILEPYYTGSHKSWVDGIQKNSRHTITVLTLKGQFWKWRMHGGAVTLARKINEIHTLPDLILATDMLDLSTFLGLTRKRLRDIPAAVYFHENQLAYPWSPRDRDLYHKRDKHYGFINFISALSADYVLFNSEYNRNSFLEILPGFLNHFPDHTEVGQLEKLRLKSGVLPLGMDLASFDLYREKTNHHPPILLWNHRWEHDKNPKSFFNTLYRLEEHSVEYQLVLLGQNFRKEPEEFIQAKKALEHRLLHAGYVTNFAEYAAWLWRSDILPVTSLHDFFGTSVCEAAYCDCLPLLPDRLAYPEIFQAYPNLFYKNQTELEKKLLSHLETPAKCSAARAVKPYDWNVLIESYDTLFERMAEHEPADSVVALSETFNIERKNSKNRYSRSSQR